MMDIFKVTTRPDKSLFFRSHDPHDIKMGNITASDPADYRDAEIVILGYPHDEGVTRNNGRAGAREAPGEIRRALYRFSAPGEIQQLRIFDLGDTSIQPTLEETHELHVETVQQILQDGKRLIVLGGGNDISYADGKGLSHWNPNFIAFNIDSHFDVRENQPRNSGTPYRQLLEEKLFQPQRFYQIGSKPFTNSPVYEQYLKEKGVQIFPLSALRREGIESLFERILNDPAAEAVFWGFDMDVVRTADAPGVSATYPVGLTADEICHIARIAGEEKRTRIFEITEVNPRFDQDFRTCKLAAIMIMYYLSSLAVRLYHKKAR